MTEQTLVDLLHVPSRGHSEPTLQPRYYRNPLRIYSDWLYRNLDKNLLLLHEEMGSLVNQI